MKTQETAWCGIRYIYTALVYTNNMAATVCTLVAVLCVASVTMINDYHGNFQSHYYDYSTYLFTIA